MCLHKVAYQLASPQVCPVCARPVFPQKSHSEAVSSPPTAIAPKAIYKGDLPHSIAMILGKHQNALRSGFHYPSYKFRRKAFLLLPQDFWDSRAGLLGSENIRAFIKVALSILKVSFLPDAQVYLGSLSILEATCARNHELRSQLGPAVASRVRDQHPSPHPPYGPCSQGTPITLHCVIQIPSGIPQFTLYLCISEYVWTEFSPRVCQPQ